MFYPSDDASPRHRLADVKAQVEVAAGQAMDMLTPLAIDAKERLVPLALDAKDRLVPLAEVAVQKARPVMDEALAKMADVVDNDIKPRLVEWQKQATPMLDEATHRGRLAVAAIKGDIEPPAPPKRRRGHPILKTIGIATIAAALLLLIRALLDARDDGWELQDTIFEETPEPEEDEETPEPDDQVPEPAEDDAAASDPDRYGEGSYIGQEPPDGYIIKGNERSMKYHVPKAIGYERCVTDIWFNSSEAAERAGFTRALR